MSKIYIVPSPIGNRDDITLRAINTLKACHLIACEDTRHSGILLKHLHIQKPLVALHQHNEHQSIPRLLETVSSGKILAVITDAGTPGISDPGFLIVREAIKKNIPVCVLPGPTAFVPALVASGLPCDRFVFEGFLPTKKGRQTRLMNLQTEGRTMIFYEAPHRLVRTLTELGNFLGKHRPAAICREISKIYEEIRRGTIIELLKDLTQQPAIKGEIVLIIAGKDFSNEPNTEKIINEITFDDMINES
jgi:16S rRNA (cytidine1402-2'-O)-methyltransferase